jgi:hypothetical protein
MQIHQLVNFQDFFYSTILSSVVIMKNFLSNKNVESETFSVKCMIARCGAESTMKGLIEGLLRETHSLRFCLVNKSMLLIKIPSALSAGFCFDAFAQNPEKILSNASLSNHCHSVHKTIING